MFHSTLSTCTNMSAAQFAPHRANLRLPIDVFVPLLQFLLPFVRTHLDVDDKLPKMPNKDGICMIFG